jgi:hypothetical protein
MGIIKVKLINAYIHIVNIISPYYNLRHDMLMFLTSALVMLGAHTLGESNHEMKFVTLMVK